MLALALHVHSVTGLAVLLAAGAVAASILSLAWRRASPALLFSLALGLQIFSGNSRHIGFPIGPDRVCLVLALIVLARDRGRARRAGVVLPEVPWGLVHLMIAIVGGWAVVSAAFAHTLLTSLGFYALLDRLGLVPFIFFTLAPIVFPTERERQVLLRVLVVVGFYLGFVAVAEGIHVNALVFPRYILNPNLGIHADRARGPFLEAVANGLAMFECIVAAAIALGTWRHRWARTLAISTIVLCSAGVVFTLTRAVWLGAIAAPVAMLTSKRLRRWLVPAVAIAALGLVIALATAPNLRAHVKARANTVGSVWDRYNTDAAALRIVEAHPLTGVGWEKFVVVSPDWLRQAGTYPLTGTDIEVHDVPLSHAAELGIPAALLWVIGLGLAVGPGLFRRSSPDLARWSIGLLAVAVNWVVVAAFGPLSYALPNSLLWLWAGLMRPAVWPTRPRPPGRPRPVARPRPAGRKSAAGALVPGRPTAVR